MKNYVMFDFGESYFRGRPVVEVVLEKMPVSISLGIWTTLLTYLISIPLGIRSHRRESSIGIGMALVLFFSFYLFIILSDAMVDRPEWRPDMIPWIPVLGCQAIGFALMQKNR